MIQDMIGKDLSRVCLPVYFNEPLSMLQKLPEDVEYSELLDKVTLKCWGVVAWWEHADCRHQVRSRRVARRLGTCSGHWRDSMSMGARHGHEGTHHFVCAAKRGCNQ